MVKEKTVAATDGSTVEFESEDQFQAACYIWHHNTFPQFRKLLHANNNNSENRIKGNQNKAKGVVPGVADLEYNFHGITYFLELKIKGRTQSDDQIKFQELMSQHGFPYHIIRSLDRFKELITEIHLRA